MEGIHGGASWVASKVGGREQAQVLCKENYYLTYARRKNLGHGLYQRDWSVCFRRQVIRFAWLMYDQGVINLPNVRVVLDMESGSKKLAQPWD